MTPKMDAASHLPLAQTQFPGRHLLLISEVAKALQCTETHVRDLIDEGQIITIDIASPPDAGKAARKCLRIPVASYDNFLRARAL